MRVKDLQADVDDMQKMLEGYIDFAKGETDEETTRIDICEVLERHDMEASSATRLSKSSANPDWQSVFRASAFARLVANLVSNAFAYADTLKVKVAKRSKGLTITFDDDGPGIPKKPA